MSVPKRAEDSTFSRKYCTNYNHSLLNDKDWIVYWGKANYLQMPHLLRELVINYCNETIRHTFHHQRR